MSLNLASFESQVKSNPSLSHLLDLIDFEISTTDIKLRSANDFSQIKFLQGQSEILVRYKKLLERAK